MLRRLLPDWQISIKPKLAIPAVANDAALAIIHTMGRGPYDKQRPEDQDHMIAELRLWFGWTQAELEERAGFSQGYVSKIESDKRGLHKGNMPKFAAAFGIKQHELFMRPQTSQRDELDEFISGLTEPEDRKRGLGIMKLTFPGKATGAETKEDAPTSEPAAAKRRKQKKKGDDGGDL